MQTVRRRVLATKFSYQRFGQIGALDPAAFWLGPTCVVRITSCVGPPINDGPSGNPTTMAQLALILNKGDFKCVKSFCPWLFWR